MKWRRRQRSDRARSCKDCMGERGDKGARYADGKPPCSISGAPLFFQCAQNEATAQATAVRHRRHRRRCEMTSRALLVRLEAKPGMEAPPDTKGLLLTFPAKTGHAAQAEQFVRDAQPWVRDEQKTTSWFGLRMENGDYGIFDVFPDNGGRFSHLTGHVPRELATHALSLLGGMPDITLLDVLAEHFKFPLGSVTGDPGSG